MSPLETEINQAAHKQNDNNQQLSCSLNSPCFWSDILIALHIVVNIAFVFINHNYLPHIYHL